MTNIFSLSNFSGGEATIYPFTNMPPKMNQKLVNCHVSGTGGIAKNPGYVRLNLEDVSPAGQFKTGFEFKKSDGTSQVLGAAAGKVFKLDGVVLSQIKTGLDASAKLWFAQAGDVCVMGNGVDTPIKYNGTTVSNLGGLPSGTKFKKPHVHKGRVWWVDSISKMTAFHSGLNKVEDYTTANDAGYIDFRYILPEGDELIDILTFIDLLIFVFRNHLAIYAGSDPTSSGDFMLVQIVNKIGAIGPGATAAIGTDLYVLHTSGLRSLRQVMNVGSLTLGELSHPIQPSLQREIKNDIRKEFSIGHFPEKSWIMFHVGETVWVYSYYWKAWGRMIGGDINGMFNLADDSLYLCGTGRLYQYGRAWSFDSMPMQLSWEGPWVKFSNQGFTGFPKLIELSCGQGVNVSLDVMLRYDLGAVSSENIMTVQTSPGYSMMDEATQSEWEDSFFMDAVNDYEYVRVPAFGSGKTMQMIISNLSDKGPIEWNNILVQGNIGRRV